jgi:cytochrome c6
MNLTNLFLILFSLLINNENTIEKGEILFQQYCNQCHQNGTTILFPEKNLKKENLERNGINSIEAISYQLKNGKNGMPAFGGKLKEEEIKKIANYIIEKGEKDFK